MTNREAERAAERKFPEYTADASLAGKVHRIELTPLTSERAPTLNVDDFERLNAEGASFEAALAKLDPPRL